MGHLYFRYLQRQYLMPSLLPRSGGPRGIQDGNLTAFYTCVASAKLLERIRLALTNCEDPPPVRVQKYVLSTALVFE